MMARKGQHDETYGGRVFLGSCTCMSDLQPKIHTYQNDTTAWASSAQEIIC